MRAASWLVEEGVNRIDAFDGGYKLMEASSLRDGQMQKLRTPRPVKTSHRNSALGWERLARVIPPH